MKTKGDKTTSIMKPVTRYQFCRAIDYGVKVFHELEHDIEFACHFGTEFGAVALFRKMGGGIVMGVIVNNALVDMYDYTGKCGFWSKHGEGQYSYWSKLEIYDQAMGLAKLAKEAAK